MLSGKSSQLVIAFAVLTVGWTNGADAQPQVRQVSAPEAEIEAQIDVARAGSTLWRYDKRPLTEAIDRLPADQRGEWIVAAADLLFMWDTAETAAWLAGYRDAADYERRLGAALRAAFVPDVLAFHRFDEPSMAALLATLPSPPAAAVQAVAAWWGRKAPAEAAAWGMSLRDPGARNRAVASAVGVWTMIDPAAAERWTLALPGGELRDHALAGLVTQSIASYGAIEPRALAAFSSTATRRRALEINWFAFRFFGANEPDEAKALARDVIEDDALAHRIEADIDHLREQGITFPPEKRQVSVELLEP